MAQAIESRSTELIVVNLIFLIPAIISILLRCFVRIHMVKSFGLDDWLMAIASLFFTLYASFSTAGAAFGTGRHHEDLEPENIKKALMCWWFCYLWYSIAMVASKLSIGWLLLRITNSKGSKWIIYIAMVATTMSGLVFFLVTMFQCKPIPFFWNKYLPGGECVNIEIVIALGFLYSSFSVVSDFIFAILPSYIVWRLHINKKSKLMLVPLLAMGCVASCAVIARFPYLPKLRQPDFLWITTDIAIWSTIEQGLAITAGSLATLRPLLKAIGLRIGTSKPSYSGGMGPYERTPAERFDANNNDVLKSQRSYGMSPITRKDMVEVTYEPRNASTKSFGLTSPFDSGPGRSKVTGAVRISDSQEELRSHV